MQKVSQEWKDVFNRDTEKEAMNVVIIDGIPYGDGVDGRLDAVRPSVTGDSFIGGFNMKIYEIDIYIVGIEEVARGWIGKTVEIFEGYEGTELLKSGVFVVDEEGLQFDENGTSVTVLAVDNRHKFDVKYEPIEFPATGASVIQQFCEAVGVEYQQPTPNLIKSDFSDFTAYAGAVVTRNKTFPIEVFKGGRNLLLNTSSTMKEVTTLPTTYYYQKGSNIKLKLGDVLTISVETKGVRGSLEFGISRVANSFQKDMYHYNVGLVENGKTTRTITIKESDLYEDSDTYLAFRVRPVSSSLPLTYFVGSEKIEKGSTPTEYSPAPEDGYDYQGSDGAYHIQGEQGFTSPNIPSAISSVVVHNWVETTLNGSQLELNKTTLFNGNNVIDFAGNNLDFIASDPIIIEGEEYIPEPIFNDYEFQSINVSEGQDISYTQLINNYAQINAMLAVINREGRLEFKDVINGSNTGFKITGTDYETVEIQKKCGPINSLKITRSDVTGETDIDSYIVSDDASVIANDMTQVRISNNPFIDLFPEDVIDDIFSLINGYEFMPYSLGGVYMNFALDQGDIIEIEDLQGNTYEVPYMEFDWVYGGGFDGNMKAIRIPEVLPEYSLAGINARLQNAMIKVDRNENKITAVVETQDEMDGLLKENINNWEMTDGALRQEIIDRETSEGKIISETNAKFEAQSDKWELQFGSIQGDISSNEEDLLELMTYFRWDEDGALIGKAGSPVELFQTNEMIGFRENGIIIAQWERGIMTVDSLIAKVSIIIGTHQVETYNSPVAGRSSIIKRVDV